MATLKGQNLRIYNGTSVIGMSTNCVVTLTGNTEDSSTKDDVGGAAKPSIVSKGWSVQVDTLNVVDAAAMLAAIKAMTPFTLKWDEASTTDNQTAVGATFARTGQAFLNDLTLTWNDRENSAKSLQFTGSGKLDKIQSAGETDVLPAGTFTKGQFVRLYLGSDNTATPSKVIAAAKQLSMHVSMTLENATTKDTDADWEIQEPVGLNYDISSSALVRSGETITSGVAAQGLSEVEDIYESSSPVKWQIANASGANNRTKGTVIVSGSAVISQLTLNGPNRQNATYDTTLTGYGEYEVA